MISRKNRHLRVLLRLAWMLPIALLAHCVSGVDPEPPAAGSGGAGTTSSGAIGASVTTTTGPGVTSSNATTGSTSTSATTTATSTVASSTAASSSGTGGGSASSSTGAGGGPASSSSSSTGAGGGPASSSSTGAGGAGGGGTHCLENIPPGCPYCETQNASDKPKCEEYLACYLNNNCNPVDPCGQLDAVCGVNTIGGGNAPRDAAIQTYQCACP